MINFYPEILHEKEVRMRCKKNIEILRRTYCIDQVNLAGTLSALHRRVKRRECLRKEYDLICKHLNHIRFPEKQQTQAEFRFVERFKREWKVELYPQAWIGNLCVDFFTPAFGSRSNKLERSKDKGIAFEIDGYVHNLESKMKKDKFKMKSLADLRVSLWRFTNEQVYEGTTLPNRSEFDLYFRSLCSRERKRIWSRIYLLTILYHGTPDLLCLHFPKLKSYLEAQNGKH